jgi:hypothetical protein
MGRVSRQPLNRRKRGGGGICKGGTHRAEEERYACKWCLHSVGVALEVILEVSKQLNGTISSQYQQAQHNCLFLLDVSGAPGVHQAKYNFEELIQIIIKFRGDKNGVISLKY